MTESGAVQEEYGNEGSEAEETGQRIMEQRMRAERERLDAEQRINSLLASILEPAARERLSNLRAANSEAYSKAVQALAYYARSGKMERKISDGELKKLLGSVSQIGKREIRIKRK
ncbi:MAG: DNA-binding protein [archaeon]